MTGRSSSAKWANTIVKDYTIQGWAMDSDRLKNGGSVLTKEYFDHLLEQIREIPDVRTQVLPKDHRHLRHGSWIMINQPKPHACFFRGTEQTPLGDPPSYCGGVDCGASQR